MPSFSFSNQAGSTKSSHQRVAINGKPAGEVWREQAHVWDTRGKQSLKWRWFARCEGDTKVLGKGSRIAMIVGAGFTSKATAADQLYIGRESQFDLNTVG
jgi:hypothetical protein